MGGILNCDNLIKGPFVNGYARHKNFAMLVRIVIKKCHPDLKERTMSFYYGHRQRLHSIFQTIIGMLAVVVINTLLSACSSL